MNISFDRMKNKKYVSFDIFDTLVRRLVYHPHQVFSIMEGYTRDKHIFLHAKFKDLRIQAERKANQEKPFADIYDIYERIEGFASEDEREIVLNLEIQAELDLCVPNPEIINVFQRCIDEGKYVIITSDMYLPEIHLRTLLNHCGITGYKKLFVSCDCKADKQSGALFRKVLNDLQIQANELIHIGDNIKSDFLRPKILGIRSELYRYEYNEIYTVKDNQETGYQNQQAFINNMMNLKYEDKKDDVSFRLGYFGLGPLLFGFSKWLEERLVEDGIEKVFFLSRDGKIMETAYEAIGGSIKHQYFYASRRALIVPTIWKHPELEDAIQLFFTSSGDTINSILGKFGLLSENYKEALGKYGLSLDNRIDFKHIRESKFAAFYDEIKLDIINNSKLQFNLLRRYLEESGFQGNIAIVDVGWFGNMQRAITEVVNACGIDADIHGYYIGIDPDSKTVEQNHLNVRGYLFEKGRAELRRYEKSINAIVEFLFSTTHGSVMGYEKKPEDDTVSPVLDRYEYEKPSRNSDIDRSIQQLESNGVPMIEDEQEVLESIQKAALDYIYDMKQHSLYEQQKFSPDCCFRNLIQLGTHPIKTDLEYIGKLRTVGSDLKLRYFAKPKGLLFYITHIKTLKTDLKYAGWRIGFISKLMKLPLPYSEIYFKMRDLGHKAD